MAARLALAALALAGAAWAADSAHWPPPAAAAERMRELQAAIAKRDSTPEQREGARRELARLLMSPAAGRSPSPSALGELRLGAPRAAIDPFPSVPPPAPPPAVPFPGVAELEVVSPPRTIVIPRTGAAVQPSGRFAVDPRTGAVLHETPSGFIDPRTGK